MPDTSSKTVNRGWILIVIAAMTWGLDILFRSPLTAHGVDPGLIVFGEHLILTVAFLPILVRSLPEFRALSRRNWLALLFVAWGASAIATWLYTMAFTYGSPLAAVLLQKTQPVFALALAPYLLGEHRRPFFWPLALLALVGAYLLALGWTSPFHAISGTSFKAAACALGASALWGAGTVAGRELSTNLRPLTLAAGRFALALPLLGAALIFRPTAFQTAAHLTLPLAADWVAVAAVPGILGMTLYYWGMQNTTASVTTLAELAYPATALLAGVLVLHQKLDSAQLIGLLILLIAIQQIAALQTVQVITQYAALKLSD